MAQANRVYDEKDFHSQRLSCSNCGWEGTGADAKLIDFYGYGKSQQVNCPNCDASLGNLPKRGPVQGEAPDRLSDQIG
jgi:ribosomal protein S27AE